MFYIFKKEIIPKYFKLNPTNNIKYDTFLYNIRNLKFDLDHNKYNSLFDMSIINESASCNFINNHKSLIFGIYDLYYNITKRINNIYK